MTTLDQAPSVGSGHDAARVTWDSFVAGLGGHADAAALEGLRAGTPLLLRRAARPRHLPRQEVLTVEGRPLGWLPQEDADWLESLNLPPEAVSARIAALVPAFQRPRILIRIAIPADAAGRPGVAA